MIDFEKILNEYYCHIKFEEKNTSEIIEYMHSKGIIVEAVDELKNIAPAIFEIVEDYIDKSTKSDFCTCSNKFTLYKFIRSEENKLFYNTYTANESDEEIYVLIHPESSFFLSNCDKLYNELLIYKGICKKAYDNKTIELYCYLTALYNMNHPNDCIHGIIGWE